MADNPKITHVKLSGVTYALEDAEAARLKDLDDLALSKGTAVTMTDLATVAVETDDHERRIDSLEAFVAGIPNDIDAQVRSSELAAVAAESDSHERRINAAEDDIQTLRESIDAKEDALSDRIDVKADVVDVSKLFVIADNYDRHLTDLDDQMETKANFNDLAFVSYEVDALRNNIDKELSARATSNDVASVAADLDILKQHAATKDSVETKSDTVTVVDVAIETDALQTEQAKLSVSMRDLQGSVANVIAGKVNAPKLSGTQGQVLATKGDGTTMWTDPSVPTDEQIGSAVEDWLEEHPEATTTVADGSITAAKLSQEVIDMIGTGEDKDAHMLIQSMYSELAARLQAIDDPLEESIKLTSRYEERLRNHASRYSDDGIGFMFFTDPHNLTWRFDASPRSLLKDMEYIHMIYEQTPAKYVFCGGDWLNTEQIPLEEAARLIGRVINLMRSRICQNAWTVYGNHDDNSESAVTGEIVDHAHLARMWYGTDKLYRTIDAGDDLDIYLLYADYALIAISAEEIQELTWLANKLLTNTKPHLFGVGHMLASSDSIVFGDALCGLLNAFNQRTTFELNGTTYDFSGATGTWHFIIGGHEHNDIVRTHMNIPLIITDNFFYTNAVDLCYADWTRSTLYLDRIGRGDSRTVPIIPTGGYQAST